MFYHDTIIPDFFGWTFGNIQVQVNNNPQLQKDVIII